jgi:NAD(P)-dependent dehydrogenase (short-subunit alcohol dehydrogenase family)
VNTEKHTSIAVLARLRVNALCPGIVATPMIKLRPAPRPRTRHYNAQAGRRGVASLNT